MAEAGGASIIVAVTFGRSSFVGRSVVAALLGDGRFTVRVIDPLPASDPTPSLSPFFQSGRVSYHHVDIRNRSPSFVTAFTDAEAVFHVDPTVTTLQAPPVRSSDFHGLHRLLVQGARNVIATCFECGVQRLVYVGSADVVIGGANEFVDNLSELRAQAEAMILMANSKDGLSTCALRVSNPFGPGDNTLVPLLVQGAKEGWAKFIIGSGKNSWDFTYIENVAYASICADEALRLGTPYVAGKPFFITNQEPMMFWDFLSIMLEGLGYQRPSIHLPANFVLALAEVAKFFQEKLLSCKTSNPFVTASTIRSFTGTRTFDCSNAERVIGYSPVVSLEDGVTLTIASFSQLANGITDVNWHDLTKPSNAENLLGNERVADILLWRDDRRTFTCLLVLFLLHYWFLLSERTFISSAAKLLMLFALILFVYGILPSSMLGFSIEKTSLSSFEVHDLTLRMYFSTAASLWNQSICILGVVAKAEDWGVFFKVVGFISIFKLLFLFSIPAVSAAGLVGLFTFFIIYEQCEKEIENLIAAGSRGLDKMKRLLMAKLPCSVAKYVS
ncbi:3beta-hydroxysteroid-dehydrogenase/decarboxylase-like isoform X2 [Phalaenopsis equestris]|uniref:3beta-hydroxysteroid- dehydrogenase/decarboxylase-like isoform X2 n=1 Tax=Phalaenopsis equestris TaxID=78828 RepID=UPI0009E3CBBD|nr:3beta-hydroxysteroid-dehydrogenase/decarboxylase-like isoform X2 [Phalaenopsis equestris]